MPRLPRIAPGGMVFHVLNRGVKRQILFRNIGDYLAFESILTETVQLIGIRLCAYCLMPNHWHLVVWPFHDDQVSCFMHRLTSKHTARWKAHNDAVGDGHVYQDRFKSVPVQSDDHYLTVVRYVERNALRANLVERAEDWQFSSLWRRRVFASGNDRLLSPGPVDLPIDWVERVNRPETAAELESLRQSIRRGRPYGAEQWRVETASILGIEASLRPLGRPKKA